ncbi:hypothetical protein H8S90_05135 [Olivibacter sp. SDN3]|uniref:hypothetical protein n=1 Tax=Olivibacter sp. SDN3 TaxID=2764720 RepID=UPI001651950F|nr:hypothetical protein [Olivibacter sp. SDN3]QNL50975.1 hypothetical protein H8S90_05135 [Olivibacter sp. SDN3]
MKTFIIMTLFVHLCSTRLLLAQEDTSLEQAVSQLDQAQSVTDYEGLATTFEQLANKQDSWLPPYYAALCYVKIGFLYQDEGDRIEPYSTRGKERIDQAIALIDTATGKKDYAEALVVQSLVYRINVYINPMTYGPRFGPLSDKSLQQALALNPDNPRAIYVAAWLKYHTPKTWGGDKNRAKELAIKSLALLKKSPQKGIQPHWGKQENQALLSQ